MLLTQANFTLKLSPNIFLRLPKLVYVSFPEVPRLTLNSLELHREALSDFSYSYWK